MNAATYALSKRFRRHPNFEGGAITDPRGYRLIYVGKGHRLAQTRGYAYEHRINAEKKLGRRLRKGEVVHHIGSVSNNHPDNLEVFKSNGLHLSATKRKDGSKKQIPGAPNPLIMCPCGCRQKFRKFDKYLRPRRFKTPHSWRKGKLGGWPSANQKA